MGFIDSHNTPIHVGQKAYRLMVPGVKASYELVKNFKRKGKPVTVIVSNDINYDCRDDVLELYNYLVENSLINPDSSEIACRGLLTILSNPNRENDLIDIGSNFIGNEGILMITNMHQMMYDVNFTRKLLNTFAELENRQKAVLVLVVPEVARASFVSMAPDISNNAIWVTNECTTPVIVSRLMNREQEALVNYLGDDSEYDMEVIPDTNQLRYVINFKHVTPSGNRYEEDITITYSDRFSKAKPSLYLSIANCSEHLEKRMRTSLGAMVNDDSEVKTFYIRGKHLKRDQTAIVNTLERFKSVLNSL